MFFKVITIVLNKKTLNFSVERFVYKKKAIKLPYMLQ